MTPDQWLIAAIRITNALLWIDLGLDIMSNPSIILSPLGRRLISLVIIGGMCILAFGAFAPTIVPPEIARTAYTIYTGFAALVALAIRRTWRP